jgi:methyl-accepting chemotaxis protein
VADEIGKLASQTTDSIKEIERVLHDSARISEEGVDVINRTASTIKELINRMLESSGKVKMLQDSFMVEEKYTRIVVEQMDKNLELAKNISTATDEQKDAIKSSSDAIEHVNEIVGEMVEQTKHLSSSARSVLDFSMDLVKKSDKAVRLDSNNEEE